LTARKEGKVEMRPRWVAAAVAIAALLALPGVGRAATITVNTTNETGTTGSECGLDDAIRAANNNSNAGTHGCPAGQASPVMDTINFSPSLVLPAQISVNPALTPIAGDVTIVGPGAGSLDIHATAACACGVIQVSSGTIAASGLELSGANLTGVGGGVFVAAGATAALDLMTIDNNTSQDPGMLTSCGGGIDNAGTMTLTRSTVSGNTVTKGSTTDSVARGGGLCNGGALTADSDTFNLNTATASGGTTSTVAEGGGLVNFGQMTLERSTIAGNTASTTSGTAQAARGGGLEQSFSGSSTLTSDTFANNTAATSGPNLDVTAGGTATVRNTILAIPNGNATAGAVNCASAGTLTSGGFNLESGSSCAFASTGDLQNTLPKLMAFGDYGGPTKTRSLQADSPAIDAGSSFGELVDQRGAGFPRPQDVVEIPNGPGDMADIGAIELPGDATPVQPPAPDTAAPAPAQATTVTPVKKCKKKHRPAAAAKKCKKKK
jgi:hypothetical protein